MQVISMESSSSCLLEPYQKQPHPQQQQQQEQQQEQEQQEQDPEEKQQQGSGENGESHSDTSATVYHNARSSPEPPQSQQPPAQQPAHVQQPPTSASIARSFIQEASPLASVAPPPGLLMQRKASCPPLLLSIPPPPTGRATRFPSVDASHFPGRRPPSPMPSPMPSPRVAPAANHWEECRHIAQWLLSLPRSESVQALRTVHALLPSDQVAEALPASPKWEDSARHRRPSMPPLPPRYPQQPQQSQQSQLQPSQSPPWFHQDDAGLLPSPRGAAGIIGQNRPHAKPLDEPCAPPSLLMRPVTPYEQQQKAAVSPTSAPVSPMDRPPAPGCASMASIWALDPVRSPMTPPPSRAPSVLLGPVVEEELSAISIGGRPPPFSPAPSSSCYPSHAEQHQHPQQQPSCTLNYYEAPLQEPQMPSSSYRFTKRRSQSFGSSLEFQQHQQKAELRLPLLEHTRTFSQGFAQPSPMSSPSCSAQHYPPGSPAQTHSLHYHPSPQHSAQHAPRSPSHAHPAVSSHHQQYQQQHQYHPQQQQQQQHSHPQQQQHQKYHQEKHFQSTGHQHHHHGKHQPHGQPHGQPLMSKTEKGKIPERIDWKLLDDIPAWLRSLRLHKYTHLFVGDSARTLDGKPWSWQSMVHLDNHTLEQVGVSALGARRKMLKVFHMVRRALGEEIPEDELLADEWTGSECGGTDHPE